MAKSASKEIKAIEKLNSDLAKVRSHVKEIIFGQDEVIDKIIITLLSGGHTLLVGLPGLAKTRLVRSLGTIMGLSRKRIQFTPDLMPTDILGSEILCSTVQNTRIKQPEKKLPKGSIYDGLSGRTPWHQDAAVLTTHGQKFCDMVTVWIPFTKTTKKNGTLIVKVGSENSSFKCSKKIKKGTKFTSEQILVERKFLKKYRSKSVNCPKNAALTTYCGIFHKSGNNTSNVIRFTIVVRYNNQFSKDFKFYRNLSS